jgi:hypothetical protein
LSKRLIKLRELVLEAAVNHLAVQDFDDISQTYPAEDNVEALFDFENDRDNALCEVINYVLEHGQMLRLQLMTEQADRFVDHHNGAVG